MVKIPLLVDMTALSLPCSQPRLYTYGGKASLAQIRALLKLKMKNILTVTCVYVDCSSVIISLF